MSQLIAGARIFVLVSHSEALVQSLCRRLYTMTHGALAEAGC
jgi:ABC-type polysaccharide/polyol phosphate transport system ATPase subunit